jgi:hypothetical protein
LELFDLCDSVSLLSDLYEDRYRCFFCEGSIRDLPTPKETQTTTNKQINNKTKQKTKQKERKKGEPDWDWEGLPADEVAKELKEGEEQEDDEGEHTDDNVFDELCP